MEILGVHQNIRRFFFDKIIRTLSAKIHTKVCGIKQKNYVSFFQHHNSNMLKTARNCLLGKYFSFVLFSLVHNIKTEAHKVMSAMMMMLMMMIGKIRNVDGFQTQKEED